MSTSGADGEELGGELELELDPGPIAYRDSGGSGPTLVLLHGLLMDSGLWDQVTVELAAAAARSSLNRRRPAANAAVRASAPGTAS